MMIHKYTHANEDTHVYTHIYIHKYTLTYTEDEYIYTYIDTMENAHALTLKSFQTVSPEYQSKLIPLAAVLLKR